MQFFELPEVEIASNTSPSIPRRLDLPFEHVVVAVVVADGGEDTGVGGQRDGAQGRTIHRQPRDELRYQMLRVGGRAAVAAYQQLCARTSWPWR